MRKTLLRIAAIALLTMGTNSWSAEYDLYLFAGQSNMDGRGKAVNLSKSQRRPSDKTIIFYRNPPHASDGWQPLAPGFSIPPRHKTGIPSPTFGPEMGFASAMGKESQGRIYRNFVETVKLALSALTKDGHTYKLRGLLWHQGESDSKASAELHQKRLVAFVARVREDVGAPNLPIVVGEVFDNGKRDSVRTALRKLSESDPACGLVSSDGTTTWDPGTHFDAKSQLLLGRRYADAMLKIAR